MSKLFKALEAIESQDRNLPPPLQTEQASSKGKSRQYLSPFVRIILFAFFFIAAGIFSLFLFDISLPKISLSPFLNRTVITPEKSNTAPPAIIHAPAEQPEKETQSKEELPVLPEEKPSLPLEERKVIQEASDPQQTDPRQTIAKKQEPLKEQPEAVNKEQLHPRESVLNPIMTEEEKRRIKLNRLLYHAEINRKSDDLDAAIKMYKSAWQLSKRTDIANNLAASLYKRGLYEQAKQIVNEAIVIAPDDPDLIHNLELIKQKLEE